MTGDQQNDARGRTGVATSLTRDELIRQGKTIGPLDAIALNRDIQALVQTVGGLTQSLYDPRTGIFRRTDSIHVEEIDTNAAPATQTDGAQIDCERIFGGFPAQDMTIQSVGGGMLQVSINGNLWIPVSAGDSFEHTTLRKLKFRVTTGAAGTARILLFAYTGRDAAGFKL